MDGFVARYESWSDLKKGLFLLLMVTLVGALFSVIFIFLDNIGVLFGWLLGSAVNIFAYYSIHQGAVFTLARSTSRKQGYLTILWSLLRYVLYIGVLLLAGFASFRWGTLSHGYCNMISASLALMPTWIMLVITTFFSVKKGAKKPGSDKKEGE